MQILEQLQGMYFFIIYKFFRYCHYNELLCAILALVIFGLVFFFNLSSIKRYFLTNLDSTLMSENELLPPYYFLLPPTLFLCLASVWSKDSSS